MLQDERHDRGINAVSGREAIDIAVSRLPALANAGNQQPAICKRDVVGFLAVSFLWALCYPLIAVGIRFAPPFAFAALRALIAGVALMVLAWALGRPVPRDLWTWAMLAAIGLGTTSLGFLGMFDASRYVSPGLATVIANGQPLAAGVAVGNILMKALGCRLDALVATGAQTLIGALPLSAGALLIERPAAVVWSPMFLASLLSLALFGTALAYWLWFALLARVPFTRANAFTFVTPIVGFAIGVVFFGERLGIAAVVGLLLTAVGIILVERLQPISSNGARSTMLSMRKE